MRPSLACFKLCLQLRTYFRGKRNLIFQWERVSRYWFWENICGSNEQVLYFTTENGVVTFHCGNAGTADVIITAEYNGISYSESIKIKVINNENIDYISVSDAINADIDSVVTVKGIVGPSIVNQTGFYLIDENGAIPVRTTGDIMATLEIGYEVILTGTKALSKANGQICIDNATIDVNNYGENAYSTNSFIKDKTIGEITSVADSTDAYIIYLIVNVRNLN